MQSTDESSASQSSSDTPDDDVATSQSTSDGSGLDEGEMADFEMAEADMLAEELQPFMPASSGELIFQHVNIQTPLVNVSKEVKSYVTLLNSPSR